MLNAEKLPSRLVGADVKYSAEFNSSETARGRSSDLLRYQAGRIVKAVVTAAAGGGYPELFLHSNINSGKWEYIPFIRTGSIDDGYFSLEIKMPAGGLYYWRLVFSDGKNLYWEPEDYRRVLVDPQPMEDGLVMYTLIPNATGRIPDWINSLYHIKALGFNTVHLLPVTLMGSSESPYSGADLFQLDFSYTAAGTGTGVEEFREFAEQANELGIMICLDIVLNHMSNENRLTAEHGDWFIPDSLRPDGLKRAGCWHHNSWISWEDLVLINYDHPVKEKREEIYQYMKSYVFYWIELAGKNPLMLRLDNLHSSNSRFISRLIPEIKEEFPYVIILSEFFGAEDVLEDAVKEYGLNMLMANSWEYPFVPLLQKYLLSLHDKTAVSRFLVEPTSHDTETAAELFGTPLSSIPRYICCALMGTGQTGIVQGFEYGLGKKINFIGRNRILKIKKEFDFCGFITAVNTILLKYKAFRNKGNIVFLQTGSESIIACTRIGIEEKSDFLIAVNFDIHSGHSFYHSYPWNFDVLLAENCEVKAAEGSGVFEIHLGPCGACVVSCSGSGTGSAEI